LRAHGNTLGRSWHEATRVHDSETSIILQLVLVRFGITLNR